MAHPPRVHPNAPRVTVSASTTSTTSSTCPRSLLLHDTTDQFLKRLKTRGYSVSIPLRDALLEVLQEGHREWAKQHHQHHPPDIVHHKGNTSLTNTTMTETTNTSESTHSTVSESPPSDLSCHLSCHLPCHTPSFWLDIDEQTRRNLHTHNLPIHRTQDPTLPIESYCALLCPLHTFKLNYVNLAVVLYGLSVQNVRNVYRYCYLEWIAVQQSSKTSTTTDTHTKRWAHVWSLTPRAFSKLTSPELRVQWTRVLRGLVGETVDDEPEASRYVRSMFFVNRLYSYMTPCG